MSSLQHLTFAAAKAAQRPGYLARTFAFYREMEHMTEDELRNSLKCSAIDFVKLALCRISDHPGVDELRKLAEFGNADIKALAHIVKRVRSVEVFRSAREKPDRIAGHTGLSRVTLLAAREREDDMQKPEDDDESR